MSIVSVLIVIGVTGIWGTYTAPGNTAANVGIFLLTLLLLIVAEFLSLRGIPRKTLNNLILAILQIGLLITGYFITFALPTHSAIEIVPRCVFGMISFVGSIYQGPYDIMTFQLTVDVKPDRQCIDEYIDDDEER